jgi:microcystin degradation protein MlrC
MPRILIAECMQEISSFNPVKSGYADFRILRGAGLIEAQRGRNTGAAGAIAVYEATPGVELVPTISARAFSAGILSREGWARLSAEIVAAIAERTAGIDAVHFSMHGAMGAENELDPEGFLLAETRRLIGERVPIVISLDLHGILTARMLKHVDGLAIYHTYPHVDFADTGERAARLMLKILGGAKPAIARVVVPALVRGDELITETGVYGKVIRAAQALERSGVALAAGFMIGNPFTDVPELCSQAIVVTDGDAKAAEREATRLAEMFWPDRALMQGRLVALDDAIARARHLDGPAIFTDAADATSSGATGDSNAILAALLKAGYAGRVLAPLVDPPAVEAAKKARLGGRFRAKLGGALDKRFAPLELEVEVELLSRGRAVLETSGAPNDAGDCAVLRHANWTIVAMTKSANLFDRSVFYACGQDPKRFDLIVVKSPHCEKHMFVDWAARNFNIDAPGATSADVRALGHTICRRPIYPLDPDIGFTPKAELYARAR